MAFDYEAAKKAGATDDQILDHLTKTRHFDVQGALSAGASKPEIIQHLSVAPTPTWGGNQPKEKSNLQKVEDVVTAPIKFVGENFVNPVARQLEKPVVSVVRGIQGSEAPMKTPFGDVKPYSSTTPGEAAWGVADLATSVPGVGTAIKDAALVGPKLIAKKFGTTIAEHLPVTKVASFLTGEAENTFKFAKKNPELVAKFRKFAEDESVVPTVGQEVFDFAKKTKDFASKQWQKAEKEIAETVNSKFQTGQRLLRDNVANTLKEEGINVSNKIVDTAKSAFTQNDVANSTLQRIVNIVEEPSSKVQDLINKRKALTTVLDNVPKSEKDLGRVAGKVVQSYDTMLDNITKGKSSQMRQAYSETVNSAGKIMDQMSDEYGKFSMDKATNFIKQTFSDFKFDKNALVGDLQNVMKKEGIANVDLTKNLKALGTAKKLSRTAPLTQSRLKEIVLSFGVAKVPILGALTSPSFWGQMMTKGQNPAVVAGRFKNIIGNALTKVAMQTLLREKLKGAIGGAENPDSQAGQFQE